MNDLKYNISKELLSTMLNKEIIEVKPSIQPSYIFYEYIDRDVLSQQEINIYELAFLFKSWANINDYMIWSSICITTIENKTDLHKRTFTGTDEVDGIIKSCEFIFYEIRGTKNDK